MTDEGTLVRLQEILGVGTVNGPYRHALSTRPSWRYTAANRKAEIVVRLLLPYSVTKRADLQEIVDHYEIR